MTPDHYALRLAQSFFDGPAGACDEARVAIVDLLESQSAPKSLLDRIAEAFLVPSPDPAPLERQERGGNIIWRDDQLSEQDRDLFNALRFLDRGFTYRYGQKKSGRGLTSIEDRECRAALARLLSTAPPPSALLKSLQSVFRPTVASGNSEGLVVATETGRLELRHRGKGRNRSLLDDIVVAAQVRDERERDPKSEARAIKAIADRLGRPPGTVKSIVLRARRDVGAD